MSDPICIVKNCLNCELLGSDNDGGDPGDSMSWPICNETYLTEDEGVIDNTDKPGFPFATEQPCHVPGFWQYLEHDAELSKMLAEEMASGSSCDATFERFKEKYCQEAVCEKGT